MESELMSRWKNPEGFWEYSGDYQVYLTGSPRDEIPKDVEVKGNVLMVKDGKLNQSMGGIDMYSPSGEKFGFSYKSIMLIATLDGNPIWKNRDY